MGKQRKDPRLEEEVLQSDHHAREVEHRLPIFSQDIPAIQHAACGSEGAQSNSQADIPLEVKVRVVDLLRATDLGRLVGVIRVDGKGKVELSALVNSCESAGRTDGDGDQPTLVGSNGQVEVEHVGGVGERRLHRVWEL